VSTKQDNKNPVFGTLFGISDTRLTALYASLFLEQLKDFIYLFERERMHVHTCTSWERGRGGGRGKGRRREAQAVSPLSVEPDTGPDLTSPRSRPEPKP